MITESCPLCGASTLEESSHVKYLWEVHMAGAKCYTIALLHCECSDCGSYITTPEQSRFNKKAIQAVKKTFSSILAA